MDGVKLFTCLHVTNKKGISPERAKELAEGHLNEGTQYQYKDGELFFTKAGLMGLGRILKKEKENAIRKKEEQREEKEIAVGDDVIVIDAITIRKCPNKRLVLCKCAVTGKDVIAIVKPVQRRCFKGGRLVRLEHNYDNYYRML